MQLNPYLSFNGQCEAAFKFYEQVFGGKIIFMQTWGDSPMCDQLPAEMRGSVMHATLSVGDSLVMGADSPPDRYEQPKGTHVVINIKDPADGERIFNQLADGGNVEMAFQPDVLFSGFRYVRRQIRNSLDDSLRTSRRSSFGLLEPELSVD